jgi:hypothetical protein
MTSLGSKGFLGLGSLGQRNKGTGHVVEVVLGGRSTLYHVYKRPFVDFFLRTVWIDTVFAVAHSLICVPKVSSWYTLVIFTASMQEYANPVIDWLDAGRGILVHRMFRDVSRKGNGILSNTFNRFCSPARSYPMAATPRTFQLSSLTSEESVLWTTRLSATA